MAKKAHTDIIFGVIIVPYIKARISEDCAKETLKTSLLVRVVNIA